MLLDLLDQRPAAQKDSTGRATEQPVAPKQDHIGPPLHALTRDRLAREAQGVNVKNIVEDPNPPRLVYDPGHPDADGEGFVAFPNITVTEEMVNMIMASRAYDASVTAMQSVTGMARAALRIGG